MQSPRSCPARRIRRTLVWLFAVAALVPSRAAAATLYADLDRDGVGDEVTIQTGPAGGLRVWLSGSGSSLILKTRRPILAIAATDIDGDGRIDLIAADAAAKLHVWHRSHRGGLRQTRPRHRGGAPGLSRSGGLANGSDQAPNAALVVDDSKAPSADTAHPESVLVRECSGTPTSPSSHAASGHAHPRNPRGPPFG